MLEGQQGFFYWYFLNLNWGVTDQWDDFETELKCLKLCVGYGCNFSVWIWQSEPEFDFVLPAVDWILLIREGVFIKHLTCALLNILFYDQKDPGSTHLFFVGSQGRHINSQINVGTYHKKSLPDANVHLLPCVYVLPKWIGVYAKFYLFGLTNALAEQTQNCSCITVAKIQNLNLYGFGTSGSTNIYKISFWSELKNIYNIYIYLVLDAQKVWVLPQILRDQFLCD